MNLFPTGLYYDLWSKLVTAPVHRIIFQEFFKRITLAPGSRVLDIGCAIGSYHKFFPDHDYIGIDPSESCIKYATKKHGAHFYCQGAHDLQFESNSFDLVFMANVVHHLSDEVLAQSLSEMERVAKSGALICILDIYRERGQPLLLKLAYALDRGNYVREMPRLSAIYHDWNKHVEISHFQGGVYPYYFMKLVKL